jgi:hypothetical protein
LTPGKGVGSYTPRQRRHKYDAKNIDGGSDINNLPKGNGSPKLIMVIDRGKDGKLVDFG